MGVSIPYSQIFQGGEMKSFFSVVTVGYDIYGNMGEDTLLVGSVRDISNYITGLEPFEFKSTYIVEWRNGKEVRRTSVEKFNN
jgi:hypothetical protein